MTFHPGQSMLPTFYSGQRVICATNFEQDPRYPEYYGVIEFPKLGASYVVRRVVLSDKSGESIVLHEIKNPKLFWENITKPTEVCFSSSCFVADDRPLRIFVDMLSPRKIAEGRLIHADWLREILRNDNDRDDAN